VTQRRFARSALLLRSSAIVALGLLGGCTTFGGNVKGSFSCAAPDGICAPSSSIDDRALAMIAGESAISDVAPAPIAERRAASRTVRTASAEAAPAPQVDARRTQERVLRIVFQPYIDDRGRLHEASAVHAVVQSGEWQQQALANATLIPDHNAMASEATPSSLADAVDRAELVNSQSGGLDPDLPDPAVVAAARARRADPVKAIQDDVAARLAPKAGRTSTQPVVAITRRRADSRSVESAAGSSPEIASESPSPTPGARVGSVTATAPSGLAKTSAASEAVARVKSSPKFKEKAAQAESDARAAGKSAAGPDFAPKVGATVKAPSFPASAPEEN